jgi:NADP-dependent 3-hydroxy acid dehydrogenase YdfG
VDQLTSLQTIHPNHVAVCRCDITDDIQVNATLESILQRWGQIDILVNSACLAIFKPLAEKTMAETRQEFEVNYFGSLRMINAVVPHMRRVAQD